MCVVDKDEGSRFMGGNTEAHGQTQGSWQCIGNGPGEAQSCSNFISEKDVSSNSLPAHIIGFNCTML